MNERQDEGATVSNWAGRATASYALERLGALLDTGDRSGGHDSLLREGGKRKDVGQRPRSPAVPRFVVPPVCRFQRPLKHEHRFPMHPVSLSIPFCAPSCSQTALSLIPALPQTSTIFAGSSRVWKG